MRPGFTFSVILPVYEQPVTARMVLECLQEQENAPAFEVIVCDDGSSPETFLACQDVMRNAAAPIYWAWQQDRGFRVAASRNNGIRMASGRYLLFLDGDHVPEEDLLARHYALHTRPGLLVQGIRHWRSLELANAAKVKGGAATWQLLRGEAALSEAVRRQEKEERKRTRRFLKHGLLWRLITSTNLSIERRQDVYLDEEFVGWGVEDTELGYRLLAKQGFELVFSKKLRCYHLQTTSNDPQLTGSHETIVGTLRNIVYCVEKWPEIQEQMISQSSLRHIELDPTTDRWSLRRGDIDPEELPSLFEAACNWLRRNELFPNDAAINRKNVAHSKEAN